MRFFSLTLLLAHVFAGSLVHAEISNLGNPLDGVYRGGRLSGDDENYKTLKDMGIDTIINLETLPDNQELCKKHGLECLHRRTILIPWLEALQSTSSAIIQAYWDIQDRLAEGKKVYVHCHWGSDRTGITIAALRLAKLRGEHPSSALGIETEETKKETQTILKELTEHKYHGDLFPGIRLKIKRWIKRAPQWLFKKPNLDDNSIED